MVTVLKDDDGKVISYCEWRLVGKSGFDKPDGKFVWINDVWVHETFRHKNRLGRLIDEVMRFVPSATHCYFSRKKYNSRIKMYSRNFWERRRNAYSPIIEKEN